MAKLFTEAVTRKDNIINVAFSFTISNQRLHRYQASDVKSREQIEID
jgi:hypothetical protein